MLWKVEKSMKLIRSEPPGFGVWLRCGLCRVSLPQREEKNLSQEEAGKGDGSGGKRSHPFRPRGWQAVCPKQVPAGPSPSLARAQRVTSVISSVTSTLGGRHSLQFTGRKPGLRGIYERP